MSTPTPAPKTMSPGARSITGSGLTPDAFGMPQKEIPAFMPADVSTDPSGPASAEFYNGAQPAYAGGAVRESKQVRPGPMGG
jgi:hypothetical protein